jgi:hypothetical protein
MADAVIEIPEGDSLTITFRLEDGNGDPVAFTSARLTVRKAAAHGADYELDGTPAGTGAATFAIPKDTIPGVGVRPRSFDAKIVALVGATGRHTLTFPLKVANT